MMPGCHRDEDYSATLPPKINYPRRIRLAGSEIPGSAERLLGSEDANQTVGAPKHMQCFANCTPLLLSQGKSIYLGPAFFVRRRRIVCDKQFLDGLLEQPCDLEGER